jgi:hypothetical protein
VKAILLMLALCLTVALGGTSAMAEPSTTEKRQDIRRLIEMTGMGGVTAQCTDTMSRQLVFIFREARQEIPADLFPIIRKELETYFNDHAAGPNGIMERVVPLYDRQFSHAEIRELLRFYQSDVGQKTAALMPMLSRESLEAALDWGQEITPQLLARVEKVLRSR